MLWLPEMVGAASISGIVGVLPILGVLAHGCEGRCPSRSPLGDCGLPQTPCRQSANYEVNDFFTCSLAAADPAQVYSHHSGRQEPEQIFSQNSGVEVALVPVTRLRPAIVSTAPFGFASSLRRETLLQDWSHRFPVGQPCNPENQNTCFSCRFDQLSTLGIL
jgi:hypothetical protein